MEQHAERQRQHAEEDAGVTHADGADHERYQSGRQRRRKQQQFEAQHAELRGQHCRAIGADTEKQGVSE